MAGHHDETPPGAGPPGGGRPPAGASAGGTGLDAGFGVPATEAPATGEVPATEASATEAPSGESAVADMDAKIAELEDRWLRSAAELDNLRKRIARDAERIRAEERARLMREWLPIVDNLDLALRHAGADPDAVIEGVRAVRDQAVALLARLGFPRHDEAGVPFDPSRHEAVSTVADPDLPPGTVVEVVRPGYGDGERQLRPAAAVVSTKPESVVSTKPE
ncbi:nucleotide exchange factor GrpE [Sphaerisporangium sp. NPDC049002]|uniref:nucleotide exchange factor GrpE n=1 Tax=unclassified Sphaerisporangium TaxID=2630420 RepID=UPI0033DA5703